MRETIYLMQSSFATGEVSPEVASRIDMEKYQAALLQAENCLYQALWCRLQKARIHLLRHGQEE